MTRKLRSVEEVHADYLKAHPDDIDGFLTMAFEDYAQDGDSVVFLTQLRTIARAKGISQMAKEIGMSRQGLQKALSDKGKPAYENINAIVNSMGYKLMPLPYEPRHSS